MRNFNKFLLVARKDFLFILRDRKAIVTNILLTVAITPLLFAGLNFIGEMQKRQVESSDIIIGISKQVENVEFVSLLRAQPKFKTVVSETLNDDLKAGSINGYLTFDFSQPQEEITYIYDERSNLSSGVLPVMRGLFDQFAQAKRAGILAQNNLSEEKITPVKFANNTLQKITGEVTQSGILLFILPYLILLALIQGAAQYAIEMTAGEKERNTLATTLSMNVPSYIIALSKISVTLCFSIMVLIMNIISIVLAFSLFPPDNASGLSMTSATLLQLGLVLLPLSFLVAGLLVLLGIYSRNQKEGNMFATPLILISVFVGISGTAFDVNTPIGVFAIPIVGHVAALRQVLQGSFIAGNIAILLVATILTFVATVMITVNMFRREGVLFRQ